MRRVFFRKSMGKKSRTEQLVAAFTCFLVVMIITTIVFDLHSMTWFVIKIALVYDAQNRFLSSIERRVERVVSLNVPESMSHRRSLIGKPITYRKTQTQKRTRNHRTNTHTEASEFVAPSQATDKKSRSAHLPQLTHSRKGKLTHTDENSAFVPLISYACDVPTSFYFSLQPSPRQRTTTSHS